MKNLKIWIVVATLAATPLAGQQSGTRPAAPTTPTEVASAYLDTMDTADLNRAESLFAKESSIFESGGEEGTWQHYREHHIGPELAEFSSFKTTKGKPEEELSADRSMAMVAWPVEYRIVLKDGKAVESKGTVTFVLVRENGAYKIRHMHWSSRKKQ